MTTALDVATSEADSWALASHNGEPFRMGCVEDLVSHHTSGNLECGTLVVRIRPILVFNVIQMVRPDGESARAGRTAHIAGGILVSFVQIKPNSAEKLTHDQCS